MASTTFSGPVTSTNGFITGTGVNSTVTASTLAVTKALYNGQTINLSRAAGITVTLPAATGTNAVYTFVVSTSVTSNNNIIKVANSTDVMNGSAAIGGTTAAVFGTLPASDTITMNGSTTGGLVGSYVQITDIATGVFLVRASLVGSGTPATPFSATV
jgi:phage terminase large subunit-like protein